MGEMTDTLAALNSFQVALQNGALSLQQGAINPEVFVHLDHPTGAARFTYVRLAGRTVTALAMLAQVQPLKGLPCFQLGYAVPEKYRAQGRAKGIVAAAIAELTMGFSENGVPAFYVEAVVGTDNEYSMRVAAATVSTDPTLIADAFSGAPALHYVRKIEGKSTR